MDEHLPHSVDPAGVAAVIHERSCPPEAQGTGENDTRCYRNRLQARSAHCTHPAVAAVGHLARLVTAQNLDTGFDPDANGNVYALAKQPDGKLIVAGAFTSIAGTTRNRIARLNPDGSLDTGFASVYVDSTIRAAVVQADGRIVIGGDFDMASSRSVEHSPQSQYRVHTAHFSWNVTDLPTSTQVVAQTLVPTQIAGSKTWQYSQTTSSSSAVSSMR